MKKPKNNTKRIESYIKRIDRRIDRLYKKGVLSYEIDEV